MKLLCMDDLLKKLRDRASKAKKDAKSSFEDYLGRIRMQIERIESAIKKKDEEEEWKEKKFEEERQRVAREKEYLLTITDRGKGSKKEEQARQRLDDWLEKEKQRRQEREQVRKEKQEWQEYANALRDKLGDIREQYAREQGVIDNLIYTVFMLNDNLLDSLSKKLEYVKQYLHPRVKSDENERVTIELVDSIGMMKIVLSSYVQKSLDQNLAKQADDLIRGFYLRTGRPQEVNPFGSHKEITDDVFDKKVRYVEGEGMREFLSHDYPADEFPEFVEAQHLLIASRVRKPKIRLSLYDNIDGDWVPRRQAYYTH